MNGLVKAVVTPTSLRLAPAGTKGKGTINGLSVVDRSGVWPASTSVSSSFPPVVVAIFRASITANPPLDRAGLPRESTSSIHLVGPGNLREPSRAPEGPGSLKVTCPTRLDPIRPPPARPEEYPVRNEGVRYGESECRTINPLHPEPCIGPSAPLRSASPSRRRVRRRWYQPS